MDSGVGAFPLGFVCRHIFCTTAIALSVASALRTLLLSSLFCDARGSIRIDQDDAACVVGSRATFNGE